MIAAPCSAEPVSSIRQYTRYKVLDGLQSMPGGEDVDNPDMLLAAQAVSRKPGGVEAAVAAVEWSPVLYCYFRRWLTSEGAEAVAGALPGKGYGRRRRCSANRTSLTRPARARTAHLSLQPSSRTSSSTAASTARRRV